MKKAPILLSALVGALLVFAPALVEAARRPQEPPSAADRAAEREAVRKTISACIGWAKDKNLALFYSVIAHDDDYVSISRSPAINRTMDAKEAAMIVPRGSRER